MTAVLETLKDETLQKALTPLESNKLLAEQILSQKIFDPHSERRKK